MKRVILDTNIYGLILKVKEEEKIINQLSSKKDILIYGFDIIRKELRDVPKKIKIDNKNLRVVILNLYDKIIKTHSLENKSYIKKLAENYFQTFKEINKNASKKKMMNDFFIVACASKNNLDIVVSEDERTMFNQDSLKTYRIVNKIKGLSTPEFINYEKFKRLLI